MTTTRSAVWAIRLSILLICAPAVAAAQTDSAGQTQLKRDARLTLTVVDQSGGVLAGATVKVIGLDDATKTITIPTVQADAKGIATFEALAPGRYSFQAEFAGFDLGLLRDQRVRSGDNKHVIILPLKKMQDAVTVGTDKQTAASDRSRQTFGTSLTSTEIQALSDDPDELKRQLQELAGPDAIFRVDSFEGGQLPLKSQIKSVHITRDQFAAETEQPGSVFVDLITQAGVGALRGGINLNFRDNSMSAKSPFTETKAAGQNKGAGVNLSGTILKEKADFSVAVNGAKTYQYPELNAITPTGQQSQVLTIRQPNSNYFYAGTFNWAPSREQTVRFGLSGNHFQSENDNVGGFNLPERASSSLQNNVSIRLQEAGPIGRRRFLNTRLSLNSNEFSQHSAIEAPTVIVQDAFTSGGAQASGRNKSIDYLFASDLDYVRGIHSWRAGVQVRGGWWKSDLNNNYLGTFTFANLADYNAGKPILYTRSLGDPKISYTDAQTGVYLQDDIRVRKGFTLSPGVRYSVQKGYDDYGAIEPRIGITWSPSVNGKTTLRASTGIFHNFVPPGVYEQTLRLDGVRQKELTINNPSYPDPGTGGVIPPVNKYLIGDVKLMRNLKHGVGIDHTFSPKFRINFLYSYFHQVQLPRGANLNPLVNGVRADPAFANIIELVTDGQIRRHDIFVNWNLNPMAGGAPSSKRIDWRRWTLNGGFSRLRAYRNAQGGFNVPPSGTLDTEWGRGPADTPYRINLSFVSQQIRDVTLNLSLNASDGRPYMRTTGRDDNHDGLLNDRPAGVGILSLRTSDQASLNLRAQYSFTAGTRPISASAATPQGPGGPQPRFRVGLFFNVVNLTNRKNYDGFSGVETSPFFMLPTRVNGMRRADMGMNIQF